ncbi:MAG: SDR family oxidoreductase [archaeon]|nr:SDR family oxidoreductase [archaeon]
MAAEHKGLVIVTGCSSGIGLETVIQLSKAGYATLALARRVEKLPSDLANSLSVGCDVTDLASFLAAVKQAEERFGPAEAIINNAGAMMLGRVETQDPSEWSTMLNANVIGVLNGMKAVLQGFYERKRGTVINVSSIAGRKLFSDHSVYCATKFAVHALTEGVREEAAAHNVRCVCIAPGVVETELLSHTSSDKIKTGYEAWKTTIDPLQSIDIAECILFVLSRPAHVCIREMVIGPTKQAP